MPSEVFKLQIDNTQFVQGLKDSESQAADSTGAITASLLKINPAGSAGANGIHMVGESLKMTRAEISESNGSIAMLGDMLGVRIPRHARTAISSLELIGPALNAAFNTVVVLAVADAIFKAGEKAYEFFKKADEAAEKNRQANDELAGSLSKTNMELDVSNDKLEKHIAILEKKPYNGLKASLDEAALSAYDLAQKLDVDIQKERALLQAQDHGALGQALLGQSGTSSSQTHLNKLNSDQNNEDAAYQQQLSHAKQVGETKEQIDALELSHLQTKAHITQDAYNDLQKEYNLRKEVEALSSLTYTQLHGTDHTTGMHVSAAGGGLTGVGQDRSARLAQLRSMFSDNPSEDLNSMGGLLGTVGLLAHGQFSEAANREDKTTEGNDEEKNRRAEAGKQAQSAAGKKQMEEFEAQLAAMKQLQAVTVQDEYAFWQARVQATQKGSANWLAINKTLGTEAQQMARDAHTSIANITKKEKADKETQAPQGDPALKMLIEQSEDLLHVGERWASFNAEMAKGAQIRDNITHELLLTNLQIELSHGLIDKHSAAMEEASIHAKEYADKIADLRAELKKIQDDPGLTPVQKATASARVTNQISTTAGQAKVTAAKDADVTKSTSIGGAENDYLSSKQHELSGSDAFINQMKEAQNQFLSGMSNNIGDLILGEKTNWAAFLKSMASTLVGDGLKQLMGAGISFLPHFADGGYTGSDPILVGERGPEIFNPGNGGTVTPNNKIGGSGGAFYYVDAKEGDTATLNRNMMRGLMAVHGQAVQDATAVQRERAARMPRGSY